MRNHYAMFCAAALIAVSLLTGCPGPQPVPDPIPKDDTVTRKTPEIPVVPAEVIEKSGVEEFEVDGLKVIFKQTPGKPIVSAQIFIDGGVANLTPENAGIEELALTVATSGGTKTTPRDAFNSSLNSMGSTIGASSNRDYSVLSMRSIALYFPQTWSLFGQVVTEAAFDETQFGLVQKRTIEGIKSQNEDPDRFVGNKAAEMFFDGHPYKLDTAGTEPNVKGFTRDDIINYYKGLMTRERLTLVVVGDMDKKALVDGITAAFGTVPKGDYARKDLAKLAPGPSDTSINELDVATNYMLGYYTAPAPTHPDYYPMLVATNVLSDRFFEEVRTKRNLTYAVSAGLGSRPYNYGYLYITTVKPNEAIPVMYAEVDKIIVSPLTDKQFQSQVQMFLTKHFMRQETNAAQAATLGRYELTGGGWEQSLVFIERIKQVKPAQVQRVAKDYIKNIHWSFVGKAASVDQSLITSR
jgi:zinc protease